MKRTPLLLLLLLAFNASTAQVPPASVRLQGFLTDRTVEPPLPANGTYSMTFGLWDQLSGGFLIQQETVPTVTVVDGLYDVSLPFGPTQFDSPRWLQIAVDGETLLPRLPFDSSPYAYIAGLAVLAEGVAADGVDSAAIQNGAVSLDILAPDCALGEVIVRTATGWGCLGLDGCLPNVTQPCYSGPSGTAGVGICMAGIETCQIDGTFGPCIGEVLPGAEICNGVDENCNGTADEGTESAVYFRDDDADGFGNPNDSMTLCAPAAPYNTFNSEDCYDQNASANPDQVNYFTSHRGDGSYDYNCDSFAERQFTSLYTCVSLCVDFTEGYISSDPACGTTANYGEGCDSGFTSCSPNFSSPRTQSCR